MDALLQRAGSQAVTFVIRSGITMASGYAFKKLNQFSSKLPELERKEIEKTRRRLSTKIQILSPALDLVELVAARGNTSLEGTLNLAQALKKDIEEFQQDVEEASDEMSLQGQKANTSKSAKQVLNSMRALLDRIEEAIPLIQLALSTSGAHVSASLPDYVSPGRLIQASHFLTVADAQYKDKFDAWRAKRTSLRKSKTKSSAAVSLPPRVKVGPDFFVTIYSIFYSANRKDLDASDISWKEEYAKCRVSLYRTRIQTSTSNSPIPEYQYQIQLKEDFDDERYHEDKEVPRRRVINVSVISRLFFSASGSLLQIEEAHIPVLVLKLSKPRTHPMSTKDRLKAGKDVEWLAFAMYEDKKESDWESEDAYSDAESNNESESSHSEGSENEDEYHGSQTAESGSDDDSRDLDKLTTNLSRLSIKKKDIKVSLSLLEYLIRLSALQANDQESIYAINDERIVLYLRDESHHQQRGSSATTGSYSQFHDDSNPAITTSAPVGGSASPVPER